MKKLLFLLLAILLLLFCYLYVFIPIRMQTTASEEVNLPDGVVRDFLVFNKGLEKWWPEGKAGKDADSALFTYGGMSYQVDRNYYSGLSITISEQGVIRKSGLDFSATGKNKTRIRWSFERHLALNPVQRYLDFQQSRRIVRNNQQVLNRFKMFCADDRNLYGIDVKLGKVRDSIVATIRTISDDYPSTQTIYALIEQLQDYAKANSITKSGYPMVNITVLEDQKYHLMVGLPVSKDLKDTKGITFRHLVLGNLLTAKVTGGPQTVEHALTQMGKYLRDKRYTSPAIPFQTLLTDRQSVPDTTKWVTEVCYPIF